MSFRSQVKLVPSQFFSDCQVVLNPKGSVIGVLREVDDGYVYRNMRWARSLERCLEYILYGESPR